MENKKLKGWIGIGWVILLVLSFFMHGLGNNMDSRLLEVVEYINDNMVLDSETNMDVLVNSFFVLILTLGYLLFQLFVYYILFLTIEFLFFEKSEEEKEIRETTERIKKKHKLKRYEKRLKELKESK